MFNNCHYVIVAFLIEIASTWELLLFNEALPVRTVADIECQEGDRHNNSQNFCGEKEAKTPKRDRLQFVDSCHLVRWNLAIL